MFSRFFYSLLVLCCQISFGQQNYFEGVLRLKDNKDVPYKLFLDIDSNYEITGMSEIYVNSTLLKYPIEGKFNPENNHIFFRELSTNQNKSNCPIYAQARVSHLIQDIFVIAGLYTSQNSVICGLDGHINVVNRNFKFNLYNKSISMISDSLHQEILTKQLLKNVVEEKKYKDVTANSQISLQTNKKEISIKIFDQLKIDGDKVRVTFNKTILKDVSLRAIPDTFSLLCKKGINVLTIEALNEGSIALNTSKFELLLGETNQYFTNILKAGQKATYQILYE